MPFVRHLKTINQVRLCNNTQPYIFVKKCTFQFLKVDFSILRLYIIPARWYISSIRKLMIEGLSIHYVLKEIAILSSMILLVLTLAFKKFNDRL